MNDHTSPMPLVGAAMFATICAATASAQTIYTNLDSGNDHRFFAGDIVIDDLNVDGGGLLQTVTIALAAEGARGGSVTTDVTLSLALDGGDGIPDLTGMGDDSFLFTATMPAVNVPTAGVTEVTFDVSSLWTLVPDDALLFGGAEFTSPDVGHVFYGDPTVGATDTIVFSFNAMGPTPVPSQTDPAAPNSDGLAFELNVVQLTGPPGGSGVTGDIIDFESLAEGFYGTSQTIGDMTFEMFRDGFPPHEDGTVAIDDGTTAWNNNPDMLDFVQGNLLGMNIVINGGGYGFYSTKSFRMVPSQSATGVRISIAFVVESDDVDFSTSTITLLALRDGEMVAAVQTSPDVVLGTSDGGSFTFGAKTMELAGVTFDELYLFNNGPGPFGGVQMGIDNVVVQFPEPCAADITGNDGLVNVFDLLDLLAAWGMCADPDDCPADLTSDGLVNVFDLLDLLAAWGPCN